MTRTLDSRDWEHIPEHSSYNHNYYRNIHTGEIILEEGDDDHALYYYTSSEEDMINHTYKNHHTIGWCWMEDFSIPNRYQREHNCAEEYIYEFDSELC